MANNHWRKSQTEDFFIRDSKRKGYRSRSVYKLQEIDRKYRIFKNVESVIDIGLTLSIFCSLSSSLQLFGYLSDDFLSVNKKNDINWEDLKHIIISFINDFYSDGNEHVLGENKIDVTENNLGEIEKKIIKILETKIKPAVARDGGDIKFKEFSNGVVKVQLQGSCSGCPSSTMTLKQGVKNLLCHYIPEVKEVTAI